MQGIRPRAILSVVNDPSDYLLLDAVRLAIPYVDIARWTERQKLAVWRLSAEPLRAPVMLSSSWMAGVTAIVAVSLCRQFKEVERIDIDVLYSQKDKAGPDSAQYMDRLATPFDAMIDGHWQQVYPCTDPSSMTFPGGYCAKTYRFDTPDQHTLPATTGAGTVAARIAFDDALAMSLLVLLTRSGIWKLISGERFAGLRRSLLYHPGKGASHEIAIEAAGVDDKGDRKTARAAIVDSKGQTHLTALGALIQLERLLGLDYATAPAPGIVYPDSAPQIGSALKVLRQFGVSVTIS